ncbi:MAG: response regulator transcription factor [Bacteroidales bacterium]|nr:response regulator transcription factor [Bacteroidales bacterium]MDD4683686.1 response regulator transcription factor [Bacteroidales bacterium]
MKILIVEDEQNISSFIKRGLNISGYHSEICNNGLEAWERLQKLDFDLIIADIIMPFMSGLELCKAYRQKFGYTTPVILLTALSSTDDIVKGLNAGADDYLTKPFKLVELEARINALVRRSNIVSETYPNVIIEFSDLELNTNTKQATRRNTIINLTAKEYLLLEYFMKNPDKVLSRQTILENVWDINFDTNTNIVDVYINYIRNKIQPIGTSKLIHTVVGLGYILKEE